MGREFHDTQGDRTGMNDDDSAPIGPDTRLVTAGRRKQWTQGIVNPAVWRASTVLYDDIAAMRHAARDPDAQLYYGRRGTPTQWALADALTGLEPGARGTLLYPSGVAAVAGALLSVLRPGDELLMVDSAYEPTRAFCADMLKPFGITTRFYDPLIGAGIADLIGPATRALFMESPGSLTFEVQDVPAMCAVARAKGIATLLDNTWATPLLFPAIRHGVDLAIMACTKYVVGHSDAMLGSVTASAQAWPALKKMVVALGQHVAPDDAFLGSRGLRTMGVRLRQHAASALRIARWLQEQPQVARVLYPALPDDPGHAIWQRDFSGASGLFGVVMAGGDDAARTRLIDGLKLFGIGFSWGGFESLVVPVDPGGIRTATRWQAEGPVLRLHIGLEDPEDLIADLAAGLARFALS
jgi:cystathionine beta-lyase